MFDEAFDGQAIVVDPAAPAAVRRALAGRRRKGLVPYRHSGVVLPRPPRVASAAARKVCGAGTCTVLFLGGALLAAVAGSLPFVVILLILTAVMTLVSVRALFDANATGWTGIIAEPTRAEGTHDPGNWYVQHAAAYYHRRYVVPRTDMDSEDKPTWDRAIAAAAGIRDSVVVRQGLVDSALVAVTLPERLWEIAVGLARLSEVRERQRKSLRYAEPNDPQISVKVTRQGRKLMLAAKHIDKRVAKLEEVASLLRKADAVKRKEAALGRLAEVDDLLIDLLASTADVPGDLDLNERLRLDVQAVIDQANDAARSLAFPYEDGDEDYEEPDA
jgi:hypothetical protein